ncbi:hypothetical protein ACJX0J_014705, partial [Zea mays]
VNFHFFDDIIRELGAFSAPIWTILHNEAWNQRFPNLLSFRIYSCSKNLEGVKNFLLFMFDSLGEISHFAYGPSIGASGGFITIWKGIHFDAETFTQFFKALGLKRQIKWATLGDAGTKFFHANATIKHRHNLILSLEDDNGIIASMAPMHKGFGAKLIHWISMILGSGTSQQLLALQDILTNLQRRWK